ncbi:nucleotidyl transferase AbiEii/AbiGii toxin family protein [Parachryseolinea silvisoli]|uniref:nucleotidyl transferase AbiEii/AbiGii toxin family protein n=1 Tax=Parachryseolinea silvisoli TaxID=2873601 RepID=UPI0022658CEA|nr:nucleotidyl transferase AbiEii/AbiGii toxin family protein [Parachryseolinea silvisoli]MCD9017513.1 nucleotidyl transferase AbiEii/AbiGii toxin family protein [Parachryseolinea silvisoli]
MTFHTAPDFKEAVEAAATHYKLREIFIEKDYWVTRVLKNLAESQYADHVVFKGGTALSKAHGCIERFSEDIDLAILKQPGISDAKLKALIKEVETSVTAGLTYFAHPSEQKRGRNRKTFYQYDKKIGAEDFGAVKDHIQLEINAFTQPVPHEKKEIISMLGKFLSPGFSDQVKQYGLEPFTINVLTRERTFFEKLLSVVRLSHDSQAQVLGKLRHFYDMYQILQQQDLRGLVLVDESFALLDMVRDDDEGNGTFAGPWLQLPMAESPLFADHVTYWSGLTPQYVSELSELSWSEIPAPGDVERMLGEIKEFLQRYDRR